MEGKDQEQKAQPKAAPKSFVVRYPANQGDPLTVTADSFKADEQGVVTFTTGGATTAVVRGNWTAITQNP